MSEYTLLFIMKIHEDKVDQFLKIMKEITEHAVREPGNLVFELRRDPREPNTFLAFHSYVDKDAFDVHYNADYHLGNSEGLSEAIAEIETIELGSVGYVGQEMRRAAQG
jgi:autoinducer 2-degrading protein